MLLHLICIRSCVVATTPHIHTLCTVFNYIFNLCFIGICVQFSQGQYTFDESAGYALLKVTVSGHRTYPVSVNAKVFVSSSFQPKAGMYVNILIVYVFALHMLN